MVAESKEVENIFIVVPPRTTKQRRRRKMLEAELAQKSTEPIQRHMDVDRKPDSPESLVELAAKVNADFSRYAHYYIQPAGPSQMHFLCPIGEGSYSTVYLARDGAQGPDAIPRYAVKVIEKMHVVKHDMVLQTLREWKVLEYLNFEKQGNKFIPRLYTKFQDDYYMYTVTNYCERGDFSQFFRGGRCLDLETARFYAAEILHALNYIHSNGIIHRDVKPENILISMDGHIVISDFGSCICYRTDTQRLNVGVIMHPPRPPCLLDFMDDVEEPEQEEQEEVYERTRKSTFVGTAQYVSPEMLRGDLVGPECDLWAFGIILYQMLTGTTPFKAINDYHLMKRIKAVEYTFPGGFDEHAKDIVTRLLTKNPEERYTMEDLLGHAFFKGLDWNKVEHREPPPSYTFIEIKHDRLNEPKYWTNLPAGFNAQIAANLLNNQLRDSAQNSYEFPLNGNPVTTFDFSDDIEAPEDCIGSETMQNLIKKTREAKIYKEKLKKQAETNKFHHWCENKLIVRMGMMEKKKGMFSRERMFVLTEGPRLFYMKADNMEFKGEVPFSPHLSCEVRDFRYFNIHTPRRVYYLFDPESKALEWSKAIMELKRKNEDKLQEQWDDAVERRVWPAVDRDKKKLRLDERNRLKAIKQANRGPPSKNRIIRLFQLLFR